ncbi:MAG: SMR family transporter [Thermosynechococcaceae cyanobacterium MS004]|nr:SMR family transporter [Thermosynechococcaceae cyanobacterium MS004]
MAIAAALSFTVGGIFMQMSEGLSKLLPTLLLYGMFVTGASFQTLAMRKSEMGITYLLVLGLESVLAVIFSILFFKEGYSVPKLLGIFLIVLGVSFLRSAQS